VAEYCRRAALAVDNARLFDSAVSARAEAEGARERLLAILDDLASGFIALDRDGRVTHMNQAAERMSGRSRTSLLGRNLWRELPPHTTAGPLARFVDDATRRHAASTMEFSVGWTGEPRWLEVSVSPSREGASLYIRDVTERRVMASALQAKEEELRQSQKMEAVGRLAGGVAHDFNNLLMSIAGYAELLMSKAGPGHAMREDIQEILRSTERASTLTRQLLTYSRKQVHQPQLIALDTVVSEMQRSLLRLLGEDIILVVRAEPGLAPVYVDPGQIEQILLNLAVNSRDAMVGGGTLTIELGNVEMEAPTGGDDAALEPGRYVSLQVSDDGAGIDPSLIPHIFEPFFTTKASGKGTGLGLASVYGIVKQNHGSISVSSVLGRGSTFRVLFPAACDTLEDARPAPVVRPVPQHVRAQPEETPANGVILVAEDENSVRRFVCQVLRARGYHVLEARTGVEGLAMARRCEGDIDLVLTDVVMPELGGRGLAERIMKERPGTRILFMSGYAEDEIAHHGVLASGAQLLEKPFSAAVLTDRVKTALSEPAAIVRFSTSAA
jgi:two-component system, cell cycle sensor histidine kinase and response regulator CckA